MISYAPVSTRSPGSQPDSSAASRRAAAATGSPNSTLPPGSSHHPAYGPRSCHTNVTVSPGPGTTTSAAVITRPAGSLDRLCELDEGHRAEESEDVEPFTAEELAGIREAAADELLAARAASTGRRGPGQPGSARAFPGESCSPAAAFGPGMTLDVLPGCPQLAVAADTAAGEDGGFGGVSEAELIGVMCGWDRVEAHAHARKP